MATKWRDALTGLVVLGLSVGIYFLAGTYDERAALFPRLVTVVMMIAAAALFVRGVLRPATAEPVDIGVMVRTISVIGLTILYVVGVARLGYITASALFIPVVAFILGLRRPLPLLLTTIGFLVVVSWFFIVVFKVPLPRDLIVQLISGR